MCIALHGMRVVSGSEEDKAPEQEIEGCDILICMGMGMDMGVYSIVSAR